VSLEYSLLLQSLSQSISQKENKKVNLHEQQ
jgi:hypothetical protein